MWFDLLDVLYVTIDKVHLMPKEREAIQLAFVEIVDGMGKILLSLISGSKEVYVSIVIMRRVMGGGQIIGYIYIIVKPLWSVL